MSVVDIDNVEQFLDLARTKAGNKLVVLFFYMPWMKSCRVLKEVVLALSRSVGKKHSTFLQINIEGNRDIVSLLGITQVPAFFLVRKGVVIKALSGVDPREFLAAYHECVDNSNCNDHDLDEDSQDIKSDDTLQEPEDFYSEDTESLDKLVNAAPVMVFIKGSPSDPKCGFSRQMVNILRSHQIRFGFFDILKDKITRQQLKDYSDWPTFPQLYINGEFEGGLDIVKESLLEDPDFFNKKLSL